MAEDAAGDERLRGKAAAATAAEEALGCGVAAEHERLRGYAAAELPILRSHVARDGAPLVASDEVTGRRGEGVAAGKPWGQCGVTKRGIVFARQREKRWSAVTFALLCKTANDVPTSSGGLQESRFTRSLLLAGEGAAMLRTRVRGKSWATKVRLYV